MAKLKIENSKFMRVWEASESVADVAETLGLTAAEATTRAMHLRKLVPDLKKFPRGRKAGSSTIDVEALRAELAGIKADLLAAKGAGETGEDSGENSAEDTPPDGGDDTPPPAKPAPKGDKKSRK